METPFLVEYIVETDEIRLLIFDFFLASIAPIHMHFSPLCLMRGTISPAPRSYHLRPPYRVPGPYHSRRSGVNLYFHIKE